MTLYILYMGHTVVRDVTQKGVRSHPSGVILVVDEKKVKHNMYPLVGIYKCITQEIKGQLANPDSSGSLLIVFMHCNTHLRKTIL